jgi:hypothetical protein
MSLPEGITEVDGLLYDQSVKFYNIPVEFVMFKGLPIELAKNYTRQPKTIELARRGVGSYFFALPSNERTYIESLEDMYGVVYEYQTAREFQLLAMDDYATVGVLYSGAPENLQSVLRKNYGYLPNAGQLGSRASDPKDDNVLVNYLKTIDLGYAIFNMTTDTGKFHPELFFCNIRPGEIICNRMVTTEARYGTIKQNITMRLMGEEQREQRKKPRREHGSPPSSPKGNLFSSFTNGAFDSPEKGAGGYASPDSNGADGGFSYYSPPSSRGGKRKRTKKTTNRKKRNSKKRTSRKK